MKYLGVFVMKKWVGRVWNTIVRYFVYLCRNNDVRNEFVYKYCV